MMNPEKEYDDLMTKVRMAKASKEAEAYLAGWLQKECELLWKRFLSCPPELKDFLQVQALGIAIDKLQTEFILRQHAGENAKKTFVAKYKRTKNDNVV